MHNIFARAITEFEGLHKDLAPYFQKLLKREWFKDFRAVDKLMYSEIEDKLLLNCLQKFIMKEGFRSTNPSIWQTLVAKSAYQDYPFISFSLLILGDLLFTKVGINEQLYEVPEQPTKSCQKFMQKLLAADKEVCSVLEPLKSHFPLQDASLSENLRKLSVTLLENFPEEEVEEPKEAAPAPTPVAASAPVTTTASAPVATATPMAGYFPKHPVFNGVLLPPILASVYKAIVEDKASDQVIEQLLLDNQGMFSWRHQFLKNLAILFWKRERKAKEECTVLLRSLWRTTFLIGARPRQDVNFDAPQDIILALWEPDLYVILVSLTIKVFETFPDLNFDVNGKTFNNTIVEKLKSHVYTLGFFTK